MTLGALRPAPAQLMIAIGIDIGGTTTRVGAVDASGRVLARRHVPTELSLSADGFVENLLGLIRFVRTELGDSAVRWGGVGVALPGLVDSGVGRLTHSINLPWLVGFPITQTLRSECGLPVALCTDADAAAYAEFRSHTMSPDRFVHLRIGTGIACAMVVGGKLEPLEPNRTSHLDALVVDRSASAVRCRCGKSGCLETVASGVALAQRAWDSGFPSGSSASRVATGERADRERGDVEREDQRAPESVALACLRSAYLAGDAVATAIVGAAADAITRAVQTLSDRYAPDLICLGGGVVEHFPELVHDPSPSDAGATRCNARLERAHLGDDAGVIGAALLSRYSEPERLRHP